MGADGVGVGASPLPPGRLEAGGHWRLQGGMSKRYLRPSDVANEAVNLDLFYETANLARIA